MVVDECISGVHTRGWYRAEEMLGGANRIAPMEIKMPLQLVRDFVKRSHELNDGCCVHLKVGWCNLKPKCALPLGKPSDDSRHALDVLTGNMLWDLDGPA